MDTPGVLTVRERQLMLRSLKHAAVNGYFAAIYSTFMLLEIVEMHFDCRVAKSALGAVGASNDCALVVAPCAFRTWWSLFVAGARETSCFGAPKSTFCDRRNAVLLRNAVFVGGAAL